MIRRVILPAVLLGAVVLWADEVNEVVFKQIGSSRLSEAQLSSQVKMHKGIEYTRPTLDADIKRLHGTGNFADVSGEAVPAGEGKVNVVFTLTSRPRVGKIHPQDSGFGAL